MKGTLLLFYIVILRWCNADVWLGNTIDHDVSLNVDNAPFYARDNVIVSRNAKLTIEPGVEVRFGKGKQLIVKGILDARGTHDNRIKLTAIDESKTFQDSYNSNLRLVEGDTTLDGKLQIYYNSKWHYVCSNQFK